MIALPEIIRKKTHAVKVGNITLGGSAPIVIQSMTNTDTADIQTTAKQIMELALAGSEIVRITVNNEEAARAIPHIRDKILQGGCQVPLVGCFHYNGHALLTKHRGCAESLDKYRINPGNVGFGSKRDKQFEAIIECALKHDKPIRLGVNWGSLDQGLASALMDENARTAHPTPADWVMRRAIVESALRSAADARHIGLAEDKIILSAKVSKAPDLIAVYRELSNRSSYALHLGLTEAGMGMQGIVATTAALSILLQEGIGDTIRASITPKPGEARTQEVTLCQTILQSLEIRAFAPQISACPGCGRTTSTYFQELATDIKGFLQSSLPVWKQNYKGVESLKVAVMGCIVNGPGESKHADIGISFPGTGESPAAPVFIDGKKAYTLRGNSIAEDFKKIVSDYVSRKFNPHP